MRVQRPFHDPLDEIAAQRTEVSDRARDELVGLKEATSDVDADVFEEKTEAGVRAVADTAAAEQRPGTDHFDDDTLPHDIPR